MTCKPEIGMWTTELFLGLGQRKGSTVRIEQRLDLAQFHLYGSACTSHRVNPTGFAFSKGFAMNGLAVAGASFRVCNRARK